MKFYLLLLKRLLLLRPLEIVIIVISMQCWLNINPNNVYADWQDLVKNPFNRQDCDTTEEVIVKNPPPTDNQGCFGTCYAFAARKLLMHHLQKQGVSNLEPDMIDMLTRAYPKEWQDGGNSSALLFKLRSENYLTYMPKRALFSYKGISGGIVENKQLVGTHLDMWVSKIAEIADHFRLNPEEYEKEKIKLTTNFKDKLPSYLLNNVDNFLLNYYASCAGTANIFDKNEFKSIALKISNQMKPRQKIGLSTPPYSYNVFSESLYDGDQEKFKTKMKNILQAKNMFMFNMSDGNTTGHGMVASGIKRACCGANKKECFSLIQVINSYNSFANGWYLLDPILAHMSEEKNAIEWIERCHGDQCKPYILGGNGLLIMAQNNDYKAMEALFSNQKSKKDKVKLANSSNNVFNGPVIWMAAGNGSKEVVKLLIQNGAMLDTLVKGRNYFATTPLIFASQEGHFDIVRELVEAGAKTNALSDKFSCSPLRQAILNNHNDIAMYLIKSGASVRQVDGYGQSILFLAVINSDINLVKEIITKGGGTTINLPRNSDGLTPLLAALTNNKIEVAKILIENANPSFEIVSKDGLHPLWVVANNLNLEGLKLLLSKIPKNKVANFINKRGKNGTTPLSAAIKNIMSKKEGVEVIKLLLENGAKVNVADEDGEFPIFTLARTKNKEVLQLLVKYGAKKFMQKRNNKGKYPMWYAIENNNFGFIDEMASDSGIAARVMDGDVKAVTDIFNDKSLSLDDRKKLANLDCSQQVPLLWLAAQFGYLEIVKLLLSAGADPNQKGRNPKVSNATALYMAAQNGHLSVVKYLLENGANIDDYNDNMQTPLLRTIFNKHSDVAEYLIEKGANVNKSDITGQSPLLTASLYGLLPVVTSLIKNGAGAAIERGRKSDGITPLISSIYNGHLQVADYLIDHGASLDASIKESKGLKRKDLVQIHPLFAAAQNGNLEMVKLILSKIPKNKRAFLINKKGFLGRSVLSAVVCGEGTVAVNSNSDTANTNLNTAVSKVNVSEEHQNRVEIMKLLLANGAKINQADDNRRHALTYACAFNNFPFVKFLIEAGANYKKLDSHSKNPFSYLNEINKVRVNDLLQNFSIAAQVKSNDLQAMEQNFKANKIDANSLSVSGTPLVWWAARYGHADAIKLLSQYGADVNKRRTKASASALVASLPTGIEKWEGDNFSPLMVATIEGHTKAVETLLNLNANPTQEANDHRPFPLWKACQLGNLEIVKLLLKNSKWRKRTINLKGPGGQTPLAVAVARGHTLIVSELLAGGATTNISDDNGETPIFSAVRRGDVNLIKSLVDKGAKTKKQNRLNISLQQYISNSPQRVAIEAVLKRP